MGAPTTCLLYEMRSWQRSAVPHAAATYGERIDRQVRNVGDCIADNDESHFVLRDIAPVGAEELLNATDLGLDASLRLILPNVTDAIEGLQSL